MSYINANDFDNAINLLGGKVGSEKEIIDWAIKNFEREIRQLENLFQNF